MLFKKVENYIYYNLIYYNTYFISMVNYKGGVLAHIWI